MKEDYVLKEPVTDVARFISQKYKEKFSKDISPIKIQKSLYFLYALWAKDILKNTEDEKIEMNEHLYEYKDKELFKVNFHAWTYGPVVKEIRNKNSYISDGNNNISLESLIKDDFLSDWFDSKLESIFNTNDFVLVDVSHRDLAWREARVISDDQEMNNLDILNEYKNR